MRVLLRLLLDLISGCLSEARGTNPIYGFWVCSNSGLVCRLGLFVFFDSVCCFCAASEASGAHSETFGFVQNFWICFVVFEFIQRAEEKSL